MNGLSTAANSSRHPRVQQRAPAGMAGGEHFARSVHSIDQVAREYGNRTVTSTAGRGSRILENGLELVHSDPSARRDEGRVGRQPA